MLAALLICAGATRDSALVESSVKMKPSPAPWKMVGATICHQPYCRLNCDSRHCP
jgi:hypothetical protein